jgi:hypothetical protein
LTAHIYAAPSISAKVQTFLNGIKVLVSEFCQLMPNGAVYTGKFWLSRGGPQQRVRITYFTGLEQDIFIKATTLTVIDLKNKKKHAYTLPQNSIYKILSGKLDLTKEKVEIIENTGEILRIKLRGAKVFGGVDVILIFSKYSKTGNIKFLEAWILDDQTLFSFDTTTMTVNDFTKLPPKIFEPS